MLDGFEMFRLGAEWRPAVWKLEKREFVECDALLDVPGMVGIMEPVSSTGFVGLGSAVARASNRKYVYVFVLPWASVVTLDHYFTDGIGYYLTWDICVKRSRLMT